MPSGLRVLIASPLGHVVAAPLQSVFEDVSLVVVSDRAEFQRSIAERVRFDVVSADLIFNREDLEWTFDGLDVIDCLRHEDRVAPVMLATQGHSIEDDHLAEARLRPDVSGVVAKSAGLQVYMESLQAIAHGRRLVDAVPTTQPTSLFTLFEGRRGTTAARLAGAIASGNAPDNAALAEVARVSVNTANKVATTYIGPLMRQRNEHEEHLPLTQASVYRWCGLHARYIVSWCRRHGHADVLAPPV